MLHRRGARRFEDADRLGHLDLARSRARGRWNRTFLGVPRPSGVQGTEFFECPKLQFGALAKCAVILRTRERLLLP